MNCSLLFFVLVLICCAANAASAAKKDDNDGKKNGPSSSSSSKGTSSSPDDARKEGKNHGPSSSRKGTSSSSSSPEDQLRHWKNFKAKYGKKYASADVEQKRMRAYLDNQQVWRKHNEKFDRGLSSFKMGSSWISDLPLEEYKLLNGFRRRSDGGDAAAVRQNVTTRRKRLTVPESWDWRDYGYVTEVKHQGYKCASCYAFSATGSLEGQHKRATGELVSLSEQNLVDCSSAYGNDGCTSGDMNSAFEYIKANPGINTRTSYPYKGRQQATCNFNRSDVGAVAKGSSDLPPGDEDALLIAVATQGPISVAIDAAHTSFQLYKGGVYYEDQCSTVELDHGVLVVGYGSDPAGGDYWTVKNSWGGSWGEEGYIRMARNKENNCGIASVASFPLV